MKLATYLALVCGASAIKLSQKHSHLPVHKLIKLSAKAKGINGLEAAVAGELADGGTITKEEAHAFAVDNGVPESMMDELEAAFDAMDSNGDGALDGGEVEAAMDHMGITEDTEFPTQDQIVAAVEAELARDGGITKEEAAGAIAEWADSQGVTIPQEAWDVLEAGFDEVDADGDGELTAEEIGAAFPPKPPKKGGKGPRGGALLKTKLKNKLKNKLRLKNKSKQEEEGVNEFEAWAGEQLADGGTITKEEGYNKLTEMGVPQSMMDEIEAGFDAMDTNGDGALDAGEVEAAMDHMGIDEDTEWPTEEELVGAVTAELARDGDITKEEAAGAIAAWADENGITIPQEAWDVMEAAFDEVDANGDGALTQDELEAAFAEEEAAAP